MAVHYLTLAEQQIPWRSGQSKSFPPRAGKLRRSRPALFKDSLTLDVHGSYGEAILELLHSIDPLLASSLVNSELATEEEVEIFPVIPLQIGKGLLVEPLPEIQKRQSELIRAFKGRKASDTTVPDKILNGVNGSSRHGAALTQEEYANIPPPPREPPKRPLQSVLRMHNFADQQATTPRGLLNTSNMCFFNSVLQALVHSRPFYALLMSIKNRVAPKLKSETPVLDGLVSFAGYYSMPQKLASRALSAEVLYSTICSHPNFKHLERGRQEDAQEFMGYLLDTLEENFDAALAIEPDEAEVNELRMSPTKGLDESGDTDSDGWTQVGPKSKPIETTESGKQDLSNPVTEIFGGRLRSVLTRGKGAASITRDPFQQILLDISGDKVHTVQQALDHMLEPELLQMVENNHHIDVQKQLEFDRLPRILVVHLKRFSFIKRGENYEFGKITKPISVDSIRVPLDGRTIAYRPFAIVYHHGRSATVGHYTTDVLVDGVWYNIDDDYVHAQPTTSSQSSAYMIFYERA